MSLSLTKRKVQKLRAENERLKKELDELRKQVPSKRFAVIMMNDDDLKSVQNSHLSDMNRILKKNISCLFKTAQQEIQRKDAAIATFQAQYVHRYTGGSRVC